MNENNTSDPDLTVERDLEKKAIRLPVFFLLDVSGSMSGAPIAGLNDGLELFVQEANGHEHPYTKTFLDVEIITFGGTARIALPFQRVCRIKETNGLPVLSAGGPAALGAALDLAEKEFHKRKAFYRSAAIRAFRPWIILMPNSVPSDDWRGPAKELREIWEWEWMSFFFLGVGIGKHVPLDLLQETIPDSEDIFILKELRFREFFHRLVEAMDLEMASHFWEEPDYVCYRDTLLSHDSQWAELTSPAFRK